MDIHSLYQNQGERFISVQMDIQTDMDIRVKFVYIRAFWPREISQSTSHSSIHSNKDCYYMAWKEVADTLRSLN